MNRNDPDGGKDDYTVDENGINAVYPSYTLSSLGEYDQKTNIADDFHQNLDFLRI